MRGLQLSENSSRSSGGGGKYFEQIQSRGYYGFYSNESWAPSVNLYETDAAYLVCVDLAGVEKEKIEIEVVNGRLTLRGARVVPCEAPEAEGQTDHHPSPPKAPVRLRVHLMEIDHGAFAREVELPQDVLFDNINARYTNGFLWIELPKK